MSRWAIVGGGLLGSSLALHLADEGESVTVFEAAPSLGGLASAWNLGPIVWDRHYHVTLASDRHTRRLLRRLGLEPEMRWVNTRTGSWYDGSLYPLSNAFDFLRYPPMGLLDKARLAWTILLGSRTTDWRSLEEIPVEQWLREKSGDRVFERFWLPLLEAKLGNAYRETSAAFIWATIQRLYAARTTGTKTEQFGYVPGGYARILDHLADLLQSTGVEVVTGARVDSVVDGPAVLIGERTESFDRVIVTAVPRLAAQIVPALSHDERQQLESLDYQGIVCASVLSSQPLEGFYLTYLHGDLPFTGVVEMSAFVDPAEFDGRTLIYLPKYCAPSDPIFDESDASIRDRFLPALSRVFPQFHPADVEAFRVSRVKNVFPVPTIDFSKRVPGFDSSVHGVHLVSSAQIVNGTLNVNETLELALRASRHLLESDRKAPV